MSNCTVTFLFKGMFALALAIGAGTGFAAEQLVSWSASETPETLGCLSFTYDGSGNVASLTVGAATDVDTVVMSGDAITFADGATVVANADIGVRFDNKVVTLGLLTVGAATAVSYQGAYLYTDRDTLMFAGKSIADYNVVGSVFDGKATAAGGKQLLDGGGFPYHVVRGQEAGADTLTVQIQIWNSTYTRGIHLKLADTAAGIVGRALGQLTCTNTGYCVLGEDMLTAAGCTQMVDRVLTPETTDTSYYAGLNQLTLASRRTTVTQLDFNGGQEFGGEVAVNHDAEIVVRGSELDETVSNDFSGYGKVTLAPPIAAEAEEYETETLSSQLTKSWQLVATNRRLEDFVSASGYLNGSSISAGSGPANAMFFTLSADKQSASVQFQYKTDPTATESGLVIVIFASMRQNGDNVEILGLNSGNFTASASKKFGTFKPVKAGTDYNWLYLAETASANHYGIYGMTFTFRKNGDREKFAGYITGSYQVVAKNRKLMDFVSAYGYMNGSQCSSTRTGPTPVYFFTTNSAGTSAELQCHWRRSDGCVYCIFATLRQNGDDVEIKGNNSGLYTESESRVFGEFKPNSGKGGSTYDPTLYDYRWLSLATSASTASIGLYDILFEFNPRTYNYVRTVSGNVAKMGVASTLAVVSDDANSSLTVKTGSENPFPKYGRVTTTARTTLDLVYNGSGTPSYLNSDGQSLIVVEGGTLRSYKRWSYGITQHAIVRGGMVDFSLDADAWSDPEKSFKYVNFMSLQNGSVLKGKQLELGGGYDAEFSVQGTAPASIAQALKMNGINDTYLWTINFNVYDTTGDGAADLTLNGALKHGDKYESAAACKKGNGTLVQNAPSELIWPLRVDGGTWKFGASSVCTNDVVLRGGTTLAAAAGTANSLGTLTVNGPAKLDFGDASQLTFETIALGAEGTLAIEGSFGETSLRVGARLPHAVRARILWQGRHVSQTEDGYIAPPAGMMLFVR